MSYVVQGNYTPAELRKILVSKFNEDELRDLAYDLGVDYETLPFREKSGMARELLRYLERVGRMPDLQGILRRIRPNAFQQVIGGSGLDCAIGRYLPYWGEVEAGATSTQGDGLKFYGDEGLIDDLEQRVFVPQAPSGENIGVLRVKGSSMLDEGVHDGDLVVVQLVDDSRLYGRENRMIVTWYLPENSVRLIDGDDAHDIVRSANLPLRGPTLKVFKGCYLESDGREIYRLGRIKDDGKQNPNEIRAICIKPIGIVLKIYREIWRDITTSSTAMKYGDV
jgi:hypothetical protein